MRNPGDDPEVKLQHQLIQAGREKEPELGAFGTIWTHAWFLASVLVATSVIFVLLGKALDRLWLFWSGLTDNSIRAVVGTFAVAVVAGALYVFREAKRMYYGLLELAFGLASTAHACQTASTKPFEVFLAMAASVYLIVRGLENYFKGRVEVTERTPSGISGNIFKL